MQGKIHIGLVEDQFLFREGLKAILSVWPEIEVTFESPDGYSVIDRLKQSPVVPQVMLVDLSLPSQGNKEFSGLHVTQALLEHYPGMKIIILSAHQEESFISQLIHEGAHGYLVKDCDPNEVYEAIVSACNKGSYINERALRAIQCNTGKKVKPPRLLSDVTRREIEVLQLTCQQFTAEEIAEKLFISVKTVNGHRNNLLQKTGSRNVTGLVIYAIKNQLVNLA